MNNNLFKKKVPFHNRSRIVRRFSAEDVRLTPSDRAHNLILQKAEEEYQRIKKEKEEARNLKKYGTRSGLREPSVSPPRISGPSIVMPVRPPTAPPSSPTLEISEEIIEIKKDPSPALVEEPVRKSIDRSIEQLIRKSLDEPIEQTARKSIDKPIEQQVRKSIDRPIEQQPRKSIDKPIGRPARKSIDKSPLKTKTPTKQAVTRKKSGLIPIISKGKMAPKVTEKSEFPRRTSEARPSLGKPGQIMDSQRRKSSSVQPRRVSIAVHPTQIPPSTTNLFRSPLSATESKINTIWIEDIERRLEGDIITSTEDIPKKREMNTRKETMIKSDLHRQLDTIKKHLAEQKAEGDYHPYAHRKYNRDINNWQSISLLIRATLAAGVLKMPVLFGFTGSFNGVIGIVLILIWISASLHIYFHARQNLCKILRRPYLNFGESFREALLVGPTVSRHFANFMGVTIDVFMVFHQMVVLMKYNNFLAVYAKDTFGSVRGRLSDAIYMIPFMVLCVVFMFVRSIKKLALLSLLANILACVHYSVVLFQLTGSLSAKSNSQVKHPHPNLYFVGQALTITDCIASVLLIEEHMKHPKIIGGYAGVINLSLMFSGLWYIMVGYFGIYQFGTAIDHAYLRDLDMSYGSFTTLYIMYSLAMVIAYCVQAFLAIQIIWSASTKTAMVASDYLGGWQLLIRTAYAVLPFVLVYSPRIVKHIFMFVGYFIGPFLMLGCPAIVHFCVSWHRKYITKDKIYMIIDVLLIVMSLIGCVAVGMFYVHAVRFNHISGEFT